ncbi:hypothetical protein ACFL3S_08125, partial [Gemmatimonadota bacterium]
LLEGSEIIFSHHTPEGAFGHVVSRFRAAPQWAHTSAGVTSASYVPFSVGWTAYAWVPDHVFLGPGVKPEVEVWDPDGTLVWLLRWRAESRSVGSEEIARYREEWLGHYEGPDMRRFWEGWLRDVPFPEVMPTFENLFLDRTGHLWVEHYAPFWEESPTWIILSPEGEWLGDMDTPPGLRITEVGADYVLGVWEDELDVEYIRMYALDRSG